MIAELVHLKMAPLTQHYITHTGKVEPHLVDFALTLEVMLYFVHRPQRILFIDFP